MRITSKGQVTIPIGMRERLGLQPWTEVAFELDGNAVRISKKAGAAGPGQRLLHAMRRAPRPKAGMTTDQLMRLTRG